MSLGQYFRGTGLDLFLLQRFTNLGSRDIADILGRDELVDFVANAAAVVDTADVGNRDYLHHPARDLVGILLLEAGEDLLRGIGVAVINKV